MLKKDRVKILVLKGMRGSCEVRPGPDSPLSQPPSNDLAILARPLPIIVEMSMALWFTSSDTKFQR